MSFKAIVVSVVNVFVLCSAYVTSHMLEAHMAFELVFIEEASFAKPAIWVQENYITKVIDISSLHVLIELCLGIKLLLFEYASFFIKAHIAQHSFMLLF